MHFCRNSITLSKSIMYFSASFHAFYIGVSLQVFVMAVLQVVTVGVLAWALPPAGGVDGMKRVEETQVDCL